MIPAQFDLAGRSSEAVTVDLVLHGPIGNGVWPPLDLTGAAFRGQVRHGPTATSDLAGTVTFEMGADPTTGKVTATIPALDQGDYWYELEMAEAADEPYSTFLHGRISVCG